ncbi:MAG: guanylate kinase [Prevotella sp.]|nr:guanylate kinase [Prevotella sp.]
MKEDCKRMFGYETAGSNYGILKMLAKDKRNHMTEAESVLWSFLKSKSLGVRFRRQHPIAGYIPDFVCLSKRLIIEIDGGYHNVDTQILSDEERTNYLNEKGFEVIRFTNDEVLNNTIDVVDKIKKIIMNKDSVNSFTPPLEGRGEALIIFSAPSGSGKSTIINWLMQHEELRMAFSISCTSRAPRGTEQDGVEYFFLTPEEFRQKIANDEFLEYEEVYEDRFYGTLKAQVEKQSAAGQNVVFDVDVKGGVNIKEYYGDRALSIFIQPPSIEELRRRLEGRGTDAPEVIEQRIARAEFELSFAPKFDCVIVNDDLNKAQQEAYDKIKAFLKI